MTDQNTDDISSNARSLARGADRALRVPGVYIVTVRVDIHPNKQWDYEIARVERIEVTNACRTA